MRIFNR